MIAGFPKPLTSDAAISQRCESVALRSWRSSASPIAGKAKSSPSRGGDRTICVRSVSGGSTNAPSSNPRSLGLRIARAHDATHRQNGTSACPLNRHCGEPPPWDAHAPERLSTVAELDVIVWRSRRGAEQTIRARAHELDDRRARRALEGFQDRSFVADNAGKILGPEVVQPLVVRNDDVDALW